MMENTITPLADARVHFGILHTTWSLLNHSHSLYRGYDSRDHLSPLRIRVHKVRPSPDGRSTRGSVETLVVTCNDLQF